LNLEGTVPRQILGELQHAIMTVLWSRGEATTAEVCEALRDERGLALTTIATMLRKMEEKGVVVHRSEGRQFVYRPSVSEDQVRRSMVGELVSRLFAGDPKALVAHLVSENEIDVAELEQLRRRVGSPDDSPRQADTRRAPKRDRR
jgi:predicted transcriptional regulator